jgi:hypothetical protein
VSGERDGGQREKICQVIRILRGRRGWADDGGASERSGTRTPPEASPPRARERRGYAQGNVLPSSRSRWRTAAPECSQVIPPLAAVAPVLPFRLRSLDES